MTNVTNVQLYLAIGIPVLFNAVLTTCLWLNVTRAELRRVNQRFDAMRDLWRSELADVEEVLDARLKHLEER